MAISELTSTAAIAPSRAVSGDLASRRRKGAGVVGWLFRVGLAVVFAFPLLFMFVSSLKPDQQIFGDLASAAAFLPIGNISLDNYAAVFDRVPAARFLINSIGIS